MPIKIISRNRLAQTTAARWKASNYSLVTKTWMPMLVNGKTREQIYDELIALGPNPSANTIDTIIGNTSWTHIKCDNCGEDKEIVIQIGQPKDYESNTVKICVICLDKAIAVTYGTVKEDC